MSIYFKGGEAGSDLAAEALVIVQVEHVKPGSDVFTLGAGRG
jgi:hypothetical protein